LLNRVREEIGISVSFSGFFARATIEMLAQQASPSAAGHSLRSGSSPSVSVLSSLLVASGRKHDLPLSFGQRQQWLLDQAQPGSSSYNMPCAVSLFGLLDLSLLEGALRGLISRHAVLRTTFAKDSKNAGGAPVQVVHSAEAFPFRLAVRDANLDHSAITGEVLEASRRPFDLNAPGLMLRATLWRVSAEEHVLLVNMHHVVSDGVSMSVFWHEVSTLYRGGTLAALPLQYADYALWQQVYFAHGDAYNAQLEYWKLKLGFNPELLDLPTDRPRSELVTRRSASVERKLSPEVWHKVQHLAASHNASPMMVLLALYQLLLHRYTRQDEILVGIPSANRPDSRLDVLIGYFVSTLAVKASFSAGSTVSEVLAEVRANVLEALDNQSVPFEAVVSAVMRTRSSTRSPLIQTMFTFDGAGSGPAGLAQLNLGAGVRVESRTVPPSTAKFDLMLSVAVLDSGALEASFRVRG